MLKSYSSIPETKRFVKERKRYFEDRRESPCAYRKRDAFCASIHPQDQFRVSSHKRSQYFGVDQHGILIRRRNPAVEIHRDSLGDKPYTPRARDRPSKIDRGSRSEHSRSMDSSNNALNKEAYTTKWHRRLKTSSGRWDRQETTLQNTFHPLKAIKITKNPSCPKENYRTGISSANNRCSNGKDDLIMRLVTKGSNSSDERSEGVRKSKLQSTFSEIKLENCQRIRAWNLACALAYDYLKKKNAAEGKCVPAQTGQGHFVWKAVQHQERGKLLQKIDGPATKYEASQALCMEQHEEAMQKAENAATQDPMLQGLCMDGVVNPSQALAWLGVHHLFGAVASVETC